MFQKSLFSPLPDRIERARGRYPPMGLAYLAGILMKHGYETRIFDADVEKTGFRGLKSFLKEYQPNIVGITTTSFTFLQAKFTAKLVQKTIPNAMILIGGPHVSLYPREILHNDEFDIAVVGEGEYTIIDLVNALESKRDLKTVKGIAYRHNSKIYQNEMRPLVEKLDDLPFPARSLLPNKKYFYPFGKTNPFTSVITSRGCPHNCIFCLRASGIHFGRKYRSRSSSNICDELEQVVNKYKIKEIFFYDDVFTLNQERIINLCRTLIKRQIDISWVCRTRVDAVTPKLLRFMKQAGCERIHYGIESGDEYVLKMLRKNITLSQIRKAFFWTKMNDIETFAYIMIGSPGENKSSVRKSMQLIKELNPSYVGFFITTLFPGTDLYDYALKQNLLSRDVWKDFTLGKTKIQPRPYLEETYKETELDQIIKKCYREYYLRPSFIWNNLKKMNSFSKLSANLTGFSLILRL